MASDNMGCLLCAANFICAGYGLAEGNMLAVFLNGTVGAVILLLLAFK